ASIVDLDTLADAVLPRTENHDLRPIGWLGFVFFFVRRIKIGRVGFKLGGAGIDALVNRNQSKLLAVSADFVFTSFRQVGEASIGERGFFDGAQQVDRNVFAGGRLNCGSGRYRSRF